MFKLSDAKKKTHSAHDTRPGTYLAEVTAIEDSEKYIDGDAFIVKYNLSSLNGEYVGMFEETFLNNTQNRRTQELVQLMQQFQLDDVNDLVGVTIKVEIKYRVTDSGARFPSIVTRTPLPPPATPPPPPPATPPVPSEETP